MNRKYIIIHSSDIFRKGLHAILEELFFTDPICISTIEDLSTEHISVNDEVILFIKPEIYYREKEIIDSTISIKSKLILVAASIIGAEPPKKDFDLQITLNDDSDTIFFKLKSILTFQKSNQSSNETSLSEREKDVLKEVALGYSNKEIADRLFISIHTVISHRKNITEKLGIKSISGLTVYAIMNKIIDTDSINPEDLI